MGASISILPSSSTPSTSVTKMEAAPVEGNEQQQQQQQMTAEELQLLQIQNMPKYSRPETFEEKLYRKFSKEPLIPIGCLTTAYFLGSGIKSFYNRDAVQSQKMMRLRVGAQFSTLMIFIGYAGFNAFNISIAPGYHGNKNNKED